MNEALYGLRGSVTATPNKLEVFTKKKKKKSEGTECQEASPWGGRYTCHLCILHLGAFLGICAQD